MYVKDLDYSWKCLGNEQFLNYDEKITNGSIMNCGLQCIYQFEPCMLHVCVKICATQGFLSIMFDTRGGTHEEGS